MRLARDMGGDRESFANPLASRKIENALVAGRQNDHLAEAGPGEADAREIACAVDRVGFSELLLIEPLRPARRIIVQPDRRAAAPHVDVMG